MSDRLTRDELNALDDAVRAYLDARRRRNPDYEFVTIREDGAVWQLGEVLVPLLDPSAASMLIGRKAVPA